LNTPYSTERAASPEDDVETISKEAADPQRILQQQKQKPLKMSTQPEHPALLIPGPIEFDDAVLQAMSHFR